MAPDVGWLPISFVNVYFIGRRGGKWMLVDTGLPGRAREILAAAESRFGEGARPEAIVLTHGHLDHAGSARALARHWEVPIYVHRLELPYLNGRSRYPPPDPTVGGAIAFLSRFLPARRRNLSEQLRELPPNELPGMPDWKWMHTPGHSPGHISLYRPSDGVLLAGDAFATTDMDSWTRLMTAKPVLARAGAAFNSDWDATEESINALAKLRPKVVGAGHGRPIFEGDLAARLERYAAQFRRPRHGRYIGEAALTDENGVVSLPPAPFDPVPFATAASLILMGIALGAGYLDAKRR